MTDGKRRIAEFIEQQLLARGSSDPIAFDDDLLVSGLLDSMAVMRLVGFIESEFDMSISPGDVVIENFQTVNAIVKFIGK